MRGMKFSLQRCALATLLLIGLLLPCLLPPRLIFASTYTVEEKYDLEVYHSVGTQISRLQVLEDGRVYGQAFCVEPRVRFGGTYTKVIDGGFGSMEDRKIIGNIISLGYQSQPNDAGYALTQCAIWTYLEPGSTSRGVNQNEVYELIQNAKQLSQGLSFVGPHYERGELIFPSDEKEVRLTDVYHNLKHYQLKRAPRGLDVKIYGDQLTVQRRDGAPQQGEIVLERRGNVRDPIYLVSSSHQDVVIGDYGLQDIVTLSYSIKERSKAKIRLKKKDEQSGAALSGAHFALRLDRLDVEDPEYKSLVGEIVEADLTTNEEGILETKLLPIGLYTLIETKAPSGYIPSSGYTTLGSGTYADKVSLRIQLGDQGAFPLQEGDVLYNQIEVKNQKAKGRVRVQKCEAERGRPLEQMDAMTLRLRFVQKAAEEPQPMYQGKALNEGDLLDAIFVTDEKGEVDIEDLPLGDYDLIEEKAPAGLALNETALRFSICNREQRVLSIQRSENQKAALEELQKLQKAHEAAMLEKGVRVSSLPNMGARQGRRANWNDTLRTYDRRLYGSIWLEKYMDTDASETKQQIPEDAAEFDVIDPQGTVVDHLVTNEKGQAATRLLPVGTYVLRQTKGKDAYHMSGDQQVTIKEDQELIRVALTNQIKRRALHILKVDQDTKERLPIAGIRFTLYRSEKGEDAVPISDGKAHYFETDENGVAKFPRDLPLGRYWLQEEKTAPGYYLNPDGARLPIDIKEDLEDSVYLLEVTNEAQKGRIEIEKRGEKLADIRVEEMTLEALWEQAQENREEKLPFPEAHLLDRKQKVVLDLSSLYEDLEAALDEAKNSYADEASAGSEMSHALVSEAESSLEGKPSLSEELPSESLDLPSRPELKSVSVENGSAALTQPEMILLVKNQKEGRTVWKSKLKLDAQQDKKVHLLLEPGEYEALFLDATHRPLPVKHPFVVEAAEDAEKTYPYAHLTYDESALENAHFQLYADENIYSAAKKGEGASASPILLYQKDELIHEGKTDARGLLAFEDLPLGRYRLHEAQAPGGFATCEDQLVTLTAEESSKRVVCHSLEIKDERQNYLVDFEKSFEHSDVETDRASMKYALFALTLDEDIEVDGQTLKMGQILALAQMDANNKVRLKAPFAARYRVQELQTGEAYELAEDQSLEIKEKPSSSEVEVQVKAPDVANQLTRIDLRIQKIDAETAQNLSGVGFTLYREVGREKMKLGTYQTNEKGEILLEGLEHGRYFLEEIEALPGYMPDRKQHEIILNGTHKEVSEVIENQPSVIYLSKKTLAGDELPGAHMTLIDEHGMIVDQWVSTQEAHAFKRIELGKTYTLREDLAPLGYATASEISFTFTEDLHLQKIEMIDEPIRIHIQKRDAKTGKSLSGAKLLLVDEDGQEIKTFVSESEATEIVGLEVGKTYILKELEVPAGYRKAADLKFTVKDTGEVQMWEMEDEPTRTLIFKEDEETCEPVEGAEMQILDEAGNEIARFVTTQKAMLIEGLTVGQRYILREIKAPPGYVSGADLSFVLEDVEQQDLHYENRKTEIRIQKVDEDGHPLCAAKLALKDEDGRTLAEWTSETHPQVLRGLEVGRRYQIVELEAPDGFKKAEPCWIEIKNEREQHFNFINERLAIVPKTGEAWTPFALVLGLAISLAIALSWSLYRKHTCT